MCGHKVYGFLSGLLWFYNTLAGTNGTGQGTNGEEQTTWKERKGKKNRKQKAKVEK